jgi:hypothetical protein
VIKDYSSFLPETYVELMAQTNGCRVADVQFYGVEDINSVVLENAAFLSFAEIEGHGMFATQDGSRSREIWFLDYINHEEEKLGKSLSQALIAKMT